MQFPDFNEERKYLEEGYKLVIGCDEVGAGPVAGPVVAAACVIDPETIGTNREGSWYARVRDSKTVTEAEREKLAPEILKNSLAHGIGIVWEEEIDRINIHNASRLAMQKAVEDLISKSKHSLLSQKKVILVDGRFEIPNIEFEQKVLVKGDSKVLSIAAASIIAKVHRDTIMRELDKKFPEYGFAKHKGYGTKAHMGAIKKFGISKAHRKTFLKEK